jgi:hypothetical protein
MNQFDRMFEEMFREKPDLMFLGETPIEKLATLEGQLAMFDLFHKLTPGKERFKAFHRLRVAARDCPSAAYNLGNYFSDTIGRSRRRRAESAIRMFAQAAEMGLDRLKDASQPYDKAPRQEGPTRDIISRALTNIGGKVSNAGRPGDAVDYFRRAITIFPGNANAYVCFGNMGLWYSGETGVKPLEGIAAWKQAGTLGDSCHESSNGCPCRQNIVSIAEKIASFYGDDVANEWLTSRYVSSRLRRSDGDFVTVLASAADAKAHGIKVSITAAAASEKILESGIVTRLREQPVECRVTVMASAIATYLNLAENDPEASLMLLDQGMQACSKFEPLNAILADGDWINIGPPETNYLNETATQKRLSPLIFDLVSMVMDTAPTDRGSNGVAAFMSHLDLSFRSGVGGMVEYWLTKVKPGTGVYIPATYVGNPGNH